MGSRNVLFTLFDTPALKALWVAGGGDANIPSLEFLSDLSASDELWEHPDCSRCPFRIPPS